MKKWVPKLRSITSSSNPTVMTGKARTSSRDVMRVIQTKTGMRINVMPGALMLMMVTVKFNAPATEDAPITSKLIAQ